MKMMNLQKADRDITAVFLTILEHTAMVAKSFCEYSILPIAIQKIPRRYRSSKKRTYIELRDNFICNSPI